jgi:hypothetical protein
MTAEDRWRQFTIRVYRDGADTRRVVFNLRGSKSNRATVVLQAGGELVVRYLAPESKVPGFARNDYVAKAGEIVRSKIRKPRSHE